MDLIIYRINDNIITSICNNIKDNIIFGTLKDGPFSFIRRKGVHYIAQVGDKYLLDLGINMIKQMDSRPISIYIDKIDIQKGEEVKFTREMSDWADFSTYSSEGFLNYIDKGFLIGGEEFDSLDIYYNYLNCYFQK